jgi:hypothetical protein
MRCGDALLFDPDVISPAVQIDPSATLNWHLWIVLTEPQPPDHQCVIVSVTKFRDGADLTVVLAPGDHPFIKQASIIRYSDALIVDARRLDAELATRRAKQRDGCPPDVLRRIQKGIYNSPFTPKKVISFCTKCWAAGGK